MELEHTFTVPVDMDTAWTVLRDIERVAPCMPGATIDSVDGEDFSGRVKVKVGPMQITYKGDASFVDVDDDAYTATIDARGRESRGSGTANAKVHAHLEPSGDGTKVVVTTELAVTGKPAQFGRGVMADVGEKLIGQFADCLATQLAEESAAVSGDTALAADAAASESGTVTAGTATEDSDAGATVAGGVAVGAAEAAGDDPAKTTGGATPTDGILRPSMPAGPSSRAGVDAGMGVDAGEGADAGMGVDPDAGVDAGAGPRGGPGGAPRPAPRRPSGSSDAIDLLDLAGAPVAKRLAPVGIAALVLLVIWRIRR